MQNIRANNLWLRWVSLGAALYFAVFALIAPALHTHNNAARRAGTVPAAKSVHSTAAPVLAAGATAIAAPLDDCVLCQWLGAQWAASPLADAALLVSLTTCAALLFAARLAALCARPTPRRGLRAPPVAFPTA